MSKKDKFINKVKDLRSNFEYIEKEGDRDGYYCFKLSAIESKSEDYQFLSDLVHNAQVSESYAYLWVVNTLDAIIDIDSDDIDVIDEKLRDYLPAEVYTSEFTKFLHDSPYNAIYVDEVVKELGVTDNIVAAAYEYAQGFNCTMFLGEIVFHVNNSLKKRLTI